MRGVLILFFLCAPALADTPADLVQRGEDLGKQGEFSRAIQLFKQADHAQPSAANACRIGLAYVRRELWSQAELFLSDCRRRATASDPAPEWLPDAEAALAKKLSETDAALVDVRVDPPDARIAIASFPPDEQFAPRAIHLTPGSYTITATAPGREPAHVEVSVRSHADQIVTLVLPEPPPPPPPPLTGTQKLGRALLYGAAGVAVAGVTLHGVALYERGKLDDAQRFDDPVAWDRHAGTFETTRALAIGCYGVALAAAVTGIVLRTRKPESPIVTATVGPTGATVGLAWQR